MKKGKILVVDDDDDHRNAIQYLLEKEGYSVISAQNGLIGLKQLKKHDDILVLIVDLKMVELSGVDLLRQIKELEHPLRRIVLTAHDEGLSFQEAKELDVFSYLNKPISNQTVLFTVKLAFNDLYLKELEKELGIAKQWEELGQITGDFIHLVGNKVGIIPNYIESIMEELKDVPSAIQKKFDQINDIVHQINTLKRVLLSPFRKSVIDSVNVKEIIDKAILNINFTQDILLIKDYDIGNSIVASNASELQKVIEDIVVNAIDAMQNSERKELRISTCEDLNETVQITIHDTGCGIKEEEKDKIFRPFYSTKGGSNYGLGLFSAKNTLAKFNGTLKFQSTQEAGTFFIITLPLLKDKKSEDKKWLRKSKSL